MTTHHPPHATKEESEPHAHVAQLAERLNLQWLLTHWPPVWVRAGYVFVSGFVSIALLAVLARITRSPFVFPSLGPTAYMFFFNPLSDAASPRNTIIGHAIGLLCGYLAFYLAGSQGFSQGLHGAGNEWPSILAAAASLAFTGALMVLLRINHPPAGATTLIVSLGILFKPEMLLIIEAAVVLLTAQAFVINRFAGLPYPLWHSRGSLSHTK